MIEKYKDLLKKKKIEDDLKKQEEEEKRRKEEEQLRKELEKKREIAKSKIKEIKKHDPNRKKKKIIILGLNDKKSEKNSNINLEPDEESNEEEENNEEEKEFMDEKLEKDMKIDMHNIKYINPYKTEEQIKKEIDSINNNNNQNNNTKINNDNNNQANNENKPVKFYEIKNNKKAVKLKELAIETQYNNFKIKQNELNELDNKSNQKVLIPSNLSSRLMFSDKIFYRRETPSMVDTKAVLTENFAIKTFYNYKNNFLLMRKTLSAHKEREFKNTLIYKNSKPKYRIKLDDMSIMPNDMNKFPIYYLPYKKENGLLTEPKNKKDDKKHKKK